MLRRITFRQVFSTESEPLTSNSFEILNCCRRTYLIEFDWNSGIKRKMRMNCLLRWATLSKWLNTKILKNRYWRTWIWIYCVNLLTLTVVFVINQRIGAGGRLADGNQRGDRTSRSFPGQFHSTHLRCEKKIDKKNNTTHNLNTHTHSHEEEEENSLKLTNLKLKKIWGEI